MIVYVGRTTYYNGKALLDILSRLKDFGVGRYVYRNHFMSKYEQPSYYLITKVDPDLGNSEGPWAKNPDRKTNTKVFGMKIFNGKDFGQIRIDSHWKQDWRLIPKIEEEQFKSHFGNRVETVEIDSKMHLPPVLELLMMKRLGLTEAPVLEKNIVGGEDNNNNRARLRSQSETS